jgi:hypothetical protein
VAVCVASHHLAYTCALRTPAVPTVHLLLALMPVMYCSIAHSKQLVNRQHNNTVTRDSMLTVLTASTQHSAAMKNMTVNNSTIITLYYNQ